MAGEGHIKEDYQGTYFKKVIFELRPEGGERTKENNSQSRIVEFPKGR